RITEVTRGSWERTHPIARSCFYKQASYGLSLRRNLARGERFLRTPGTYVTTAPRQAGARGARATPGGVRIIVCLQPGGSLRSPPANFPSPRWCGIRYRPPAEPNVPPTSI